MNQAAQKQSVKNQAARTVMSPRLKTFGRIVHIGEKIAPKLVAKLIAKMWFMPFMRKPEPHIKDWQDKAQQKVPLSFGTDLHIFTNNINLDAPLVLCVHGWRGRGFQFRRFIQPLIDAGYRVATFDAPAHAGANSQKNWTTFYEFGEAVLEIESKAGLIDTIITHSFGGPTTAFVVTETFKPRKLAMVAPNFDLDYYFQSFCNYIGISQEYRKVINQEIIKLVDQRVFEGAYQHIHIDNVDPELANSDIKFWYDPEDKEISIKSIEDLAEKLGGKPHQFIEGVGHFEILKSPELIESVIKFIKT